jgi:hypothetical protein
LGQGFRVDIEEDLSARPDLAAEFLEASDLRVGRPLMTEEQLAHEFPVARVHDPMIARRVRRVGAVECQTGVPPVSRTPERWVV